MAGLMVSPGPPVQPVAELKTVSGPPGPDLQPRDSPSLLAVLSLPNSVCPCNPISADWPPETFQANPAVGTADANNQQWWFCGASLQMTGNGCVLSRGSTLSFGLEQALEGDFIFKKTFNLMNAANQIYYCITCWEENLHHRVN